VNSLRLWAARAERGVRLRPVQRRRLRARRAGQERSEVVSKVLYPNDNFEAGKELRLRQEYFFVACSIHDIVWRYKKTHEDFSRFSEKVAIQLNDTHPADRHRRADARPRRRARARTWDEAWHHTVRSFGYTNHTLLPEALERWPVALFRACCRGTSRSSWRSTAASCARSWTRFPHSTRARAAHEHRGGRRARQRPHGHLAVVGSHSVNGVAQLHSTLLRTELMREFSSSTPSASTTRRTA
jgi:starch phosphorylase